MSFSRHRDQQIEYVGNLKPRAMGSHISSSIRAQCDKGITVVLTVAIPLIFVCAAIAQQNSRTVRRPEGRGLEA